MWDRLLHEALKWREAGCTPVPTATDGSKSPAVPWRQFIDRQATEAEVRGMFSGAVDSDGLGIITGVGTDGVEMFEFEGRAIALLMELTDRICGCEGGPDLWERISTGYVCSTPSNGLHYHYRVKGKPLGSKKLARRPATEAELAFNPSEKVKVLIETRGHGGFTVVPPSRGRTHPSGVGWEVLTGSPETIPTITEEERDMLHAVATSFDAMPTLGTGTHESYGGRAPLAGMLGTRPGDDYNEKASWDDILTPRGWTKSKRLGPDAFGWTRPGKPAGQGISATTNTREGADRLYVFSSSTEFEPEVPYSKFAAITLLDYGGNYSDAAKALATQGYGVAPTTRAQTVLSAVDGTAMRAIKPPKDAQLAVDYGPTQVGTALALAEAHADELRYCPQRGKWLHWNGWRWLWDDAEAHREVIKRMLSDIPQSDATWTRYVRYGMTAQGTSGVARQARSDPRLIVNIDDLDAQPYELNTPAGIVDLWTGNLRPPDPRMLHTRCTSVGPDFRNRSELFEDFLLTTFGGDIDLIAFVQRVLGLACIGTVLEHILPFAHGSGANGKTTLADAVMHALGNATSGGYALTANSTLLMAREAGSEHLTEIAQLAGARLVVCSELEEGSKFADSKVKILTGGDPISARFMRQDYFTYRPTHTLILLGNHQPAASAGGAAFWRRIKLVPFAHTVAESDRDPMLPERLAKEAPAILAWLIRGAVDYLAHGLGEAPAVTKATAAYEADQDTVTRFVAERCHLVGRTKVSVLRAEYESWCREVGENPVSAKRLTMLLTSEHGVMSDRDAAHRYYAGIGLATSESEREFEERRFS